MARNKSEDIFHNQIKMLGLRAEADILESEKMFQDLRTKKDAKRYLKRLEQDEVTINSLHNDLKSNESTSFKQVLLGHLRSARYHLMQQNFKQAKLYLLRLEKKYDDARHDEWAISIDARETTERESGRKGGSKSKRKIWADIAASHILQSSPIPKTKEEAWLKLPDSSKYSAGSSDYLELPENDPDFKVYRDGETLTCVTMSNNSESGIKKSTFFRRYLKISSKTGQ